MLEPLRRPAVPQPQTNHQSPDTFINLSEHFDIGPEDFRPVATYLHKGSFSPETKTTRDGKIVVEGVVTEADADNAAQRFAQAYHTASLLQMGPLLQQCVEKLRRLPLVGPLALIIVTTYFGRAQQYACAATAGMEEWLVSCISGSFWRLIKENGMRFGRIMEDMPHLRMRVLDRMAAMRRRGEDEEDGEDGEDEEDGEDSGSRSDQY